MAPRKRVGKPSASRGRSKPRGRKQLPFALAHFLDERTSYLEALGRFIHDFASIEDTIAVALWKLAGLTDTIARAVFSGIRVDTAMSYIRRILDATDASQQMKDDFQFAFVQLGHINKTRNQILHFGASLGFELAGDDIVEGGHIIVSNVRIAHTKERITEMPMSGKILDDMIHDLEIIKMIVCAQLFRIAASQLTPSDSKQRMDEADRMMRDAHKHAWRHKPPQPTSRRDKCPATPLEP